MSVAFILSFAPVFVAAQTAAPLNGPWRFHTGDDNRWAAPSFDDQDWEAVDLTAPPGAHDSDVGITGYVAGWAVRGHSGYPGFGWYRLHLGATPDIVILKICFSPLPPSGAKVSLVLCYSYKHLYLQNDQGPRMAEVANQETGMHLRDLLSDREFPLRKKSRNPQQQLQALRHVAEVFAEQSENVLQEMVDLAVEYCGADSSGISLEQNITSAEPTFRWVAIAGSFAQYINGTTPRFFSPCGTCINSGRPQLYRVTQPYYRILGVTADDITDGILVPWEVEGARGTIWAVAHHSHEAFDMEDYELLKTVAEFAAISIKHRSLAEQTRKQDRADASAARAHEIAHQVNNPLQSLTNLVYLARQGGPETPVYIDQAYGELCALSERVSKLLQLG